jgi:hypothetical protein
MRKNLLFVAALMAGLSLSAGEVGKIDTLALGVSGTAIPLTTGTVVAQTASVTMSIAFDDNYKSTSIVANEFTAISVDGNEFSNGIQGATNPKDANGITPNFSLSEPVGGAALKLEVRADGFIYILHKASSHKAYTVFENGTAMGYDFAMNTTNDLLGPIFKWTLSGEGEYNYIPEGDTIDWPERYVTGYADWLTANATDKIGAGGMGYIKFPVFKDCSYIVNANGSKITCSGFYFSTTGTEKVELIGATNLVIDEGSTVVPDPKATVTFIIDDTDLKTGTGFQLKGSWNTETGEYDAAWSGGAEHTAFYDDGTNGDQTAGDNIWSVAVELVPSANAWEWGFNKANGQWGVVGPNLKFNVADATAQTLTYVIESGVGFDEIRASKTIVKTEYYTITGAKLTQPAKGINLVRKIMSDGTIETSKVSIR